MEDAERSRKGEPECASSRALRFGQGFRDPNGADAGQVAKAGKVDPVSDRSTVIDRWVDQS
jgi:hypothetical protein